MIPKMIHYCWFGRNPKSDLAEKCIASWKKICPDYEIIEWNEDNFEIENCPLYVRQAYEMKKWAFVTDYVRLQVVYDHGGIYLDTDVELLKKLDLLLSCEAYFGFENEKMVATGLGFGAVKHAKILQEMMQDYQNIPFILPDGSLDRIPCPKRNTQVLLKHGLDTTHHDQIQTLDCVTVYPPDYFCPKSFDTGLLRRTKNTFSIHHFDASWYDESQQQSKNNRWRQEKKKYILHTPCRAAQKLLGMERYLKLRAFLRGEKMQDV